VDAWTVLGVSAKEQINLDMLTRWIVLQAHSGRSPRTGMDPTRRGVALWRLNLLRIGTWFTGERPRLETEFTLLGAAVDTPL
jgi:hypothetical protein